MRLKSSPSQTIDQTVSSELLDFCFYFFFIFCFCAVRYMRLAISSAFEHMLIYRIVSYRLSVDIVTRRR